MKDLPYLCNDHQDIVDVEPLDLNLCKDPQNTDQRRNDHRGPDAPFQGVAVTVRHDDDLFWGASGDGQNP